MQQRTIVQAESASTYVPSFKGTFLGRNPSRPRPDHVTLSWASGLQARRYVTNADGDIDAEEYTYAGLFCDIAEDPALDAACIAAKISKVGIMHPETGWVDHWAFPKVALHFLAEGVQSKGAMRELHERLGLAYGWRYNQAKKQDESFFRLLVMPQVLLGLYDKPLVLSLNSLATDDGYNLLLRQLAVLDFAHSYLDGDDQELPLWAYALPVGPAATRVARGQVGKRKEVYPIVALAAALNGAYLRRYEVKAGDIELLSRLSAQSVEWSTELTARIMAGDKE